MAKEKKKSRTLFYRRACWKPGVPEARAGFQTLVASAHKKRGSTEKRTFDYVEASKIVGIRWDERNDFFLGHVAHFVPDQPTSLVPLPSTKKVDQTSEYPPPKGTNYLDGDLMFLVHEDHVVICTSGTTEAVLGGYLETLAREVGIPSLAARVSLEPVAEVDVVNLLRDEGVKRIFLDSSLYEATLDYEERTIRRRIFKKLSDEYLALFAEDEDLSEISEKENVSVRLEIRFDTRKGDKIGRRRIEDTAKRIIDESEDEGFSIVTGSGKTIRPSEIRLSKQVKLKPSGNSVDVDDAWEKMMEYYADLQASGALES